MNDVAAAVAILEGRVLVTRRAPGEKLAGYWEFPGGKLEFEEGPQECIVRELREELGVRCFAGQVLTESIYEYPGGAINLIAVEVSLIDTEFHLSVHDAYRWVELEDLLELQLAPADVPIVKELMKRHGKH